MKSAENFLKNLRHEVETHPAVRHPFLDSLRNGKRTREDFRVLGLQHYSLVAKFTTYLEHLLLRAPDSETKLWIAKVLLDEYGEGSEGKDHVRLYYDFLKSCGVQKKEELNVELETDVKNFVTEHLRIVAEEPFLVGLGAVGPGHEWSIPKMFPLIVVGLLTVGFSEREFLYFSLHLEQDIDHGKWLEEALVRFAKTEKDQREIRKGALLSLEARRKFWDGVWRKVDQVAHPKNDFVLDRGAEL